MFAPPLYTVRKFPLKYIIDNDYNIDFDVKDNKNKKFLIKQQDNLLFRQIRLISGDYNKSNKYFIFVDAKGGQSYKNELRELVLNGIKLCGHSFDLSERSASMTRTQILSFIDSDLEKELNKRITMDINLPKTVLSKYYAYRGLMLSSCHCLEDWYPKIVIVPDYYKTIPNQRIKYVYDKESEFIDKNGDNRKWTQKEIAETVQDIRINVFDGCGIHHPIISKAVKEMIKSKTDMTSILWRAPYIKGVTHEVDYVKFFEECGISEIIDIWGVHHSIYKEPMIIMTESMYKGKKYFENYKDVRDWNEYWDRFKKYEHCIGVAKWNFSLEEESLYTRSNYQILQDLNLDYENFALLAKDTVDWITKIVNGDILHTYCFLGLFADKHKPLNCYTKAILKNPEMLKECGVRNYLFSLLEKYKDEMKCGKLWLKSCFRFFAPDLIMLLEWIGGLEPNGCLGNNEFYSFGIDGVCKGEYLIERNPHICKSEHVLLNGIDNDLLNKYCSHLANVCMVNGKSITPQRLNGADFDGDLVLVVDNDTMKSGIDRNAPIVIDIDDKITALEEKDTLKNKLEVILRGMNSLIGETSNCATSYHNKTPKTVDQKLKYEGYIDLLSVINGKAIDAAKTGVLFNIPRNIAKYSKPLPYFMKYASEYYGKMSKFSRSNSNMNRLCREMEKWEKNLKFKYTYKDFNYHIMIDKNIEVDCDIFAEIEKVYIEFCKEMSELGKFQVKLRNYNKYKDELDGVITYGEAKNFIIDWRYYYDKYKNKCLEICKDKKMLGNIAVILCYEKYPNKNKKFLWRVADEGILQNIKQVPIKLPKRNKDGEFEYLGYKYTLESIDLEDIHIDK